MKEGLTEKCK